MNTKIVTNNTTVFATLGAFLAWVTVRVMKLYVAPELVLGVEVEWAAGLTLLYAFAARQIKYYKVERKRGD